MSMEPLIVTVPPARIGELRGLRAVPAHQGYRIGRGPHLFRAAAGPVPQGGLMALDCVGFDGRGEAAPLCDEVVRRLGEGFARRGWTLYVTEPYGHSSPRARVMIPSALSGGSLSRRLEEAAERFGRERVTLAVQRVAEDFFLPSPTGSGVPLSRRELEEKLEQLHPSVFFSHELCARYFTYMSRESGAHFVLFDDRDTLRKKLEVAQELGITSAVAALPEVLDAAGELGIRN